MVAALTNHNKLVNSFTVAPLPALASGHITFGAFNKLAKISAATVALWAAALNAVPGARLLFKDRAFDVASTRDLFRAEFGRRGIDDFRLPQE